MKFIIAFCCIAFATVSTENDGWVWKNGEQGGSKLDRSSYRYQVHENPQDASNDRPLIGFRPQNSGPYGPNSRPIVPPPYSGNNGVLVGPGGPTGIIKRPPYTGNGDHGALDSGHVPSWIRDDPRYQEYDTCRCRYSFNCPSTGLKFGNCAKDKKYCCFSSRKYPALVSGQFGQGQYQPSYQGAPNKYGPASFVQTPNYYGNRRPQGNFNAGNRYTSGNYQFSGGNSNVPYPRPHGGSYGENYDYDDYDTYGRSLKRNQTEADSSDENANSSEEKP